MRNLLFVIVVSMFNFCYGQEEIYWGPEITVLDGSTYGNYRPRITLNGENNPVVITGKGSTGALYTVRWNGTTFDTPLTILPSGMEAYIASWTGPDIASNNDTIIAVFKANPMDSGHVYIVRSTDGGLSFSDTIRADSHTDGVSWLPSLDVDENGNPGVVYMAHDPNWVHPRYVVTRSNDAGISFLPEQDIAYSIPNEACDCCPAEYVMKGNQHVLLYRNNENNIRNIYAVYSSDGGNNFSSYLDVDSSNWFITSCPSTGPHGVFNDDKLLTVYTSAASGKYRVYVSENSTNPLLTFESSTMMTPPTNANGIQNYPRISGENDTIFMVWQETDGSAADILCSYTTSASVAELLANKQKVNSTISGTQSNPDVIYKDGFIHVVYQDSYSGDVIYRKGSISQVGLEENHERNVQVFPNPVSNSFQINVPENKKVNSFYLKSVSGQVVKVLDPNATEYNVSGELNGIYFLDITFDNGERSTVKLSINN